MQIRQTLTPHKKPVAQPVMLQIVDASVVTTPTVRDLGVILDEHMTMEGHVGNVCRSAYAQLSTIACISRFLTPEATKTLVHALVTARLDYCTPLYMACQRHT